MEKPLIQINEQGSDGIDGFGGATDSDLYRMPETKERSQDDRERGDVE